MEMSSVRHQVLSKQWRQRILAQKSSGLSVKRWCAEQNIRESRYYYWLQILRNEELAVHPPANIFAPLQVADSVNTMGSDLRTGICALIRNGEQCLEIHNGADPQTLAATLRVLGFPIK